MTPLLRDLKSIWIKSKNDLILVQATALAYKTLVSLVPVLAVAFYFFKSFGGLSGLVDKIKPLISENLVPASADQVTDYIFQFVDKIHAGAIGGVGFVLLILTAVSTLSTVEDSFNTVWGVKKPRTMSQRITTYWSMLTIGPVLLAISLLLTGQVFSWLKSDSGEISRLFLWVAAFLPYISSGLLLGSLYFFMPNIRIHYKDAFKAGFLTGLVFELAKYLYAAYALKSVANNPVYGSLAFFPVFLLWLYVIWVIVLFGAEFCCYLQYRRLKISFNVTNVERLNAYLMSDIIEELRKSQKNAKPGLMLMQLLGLLKTSHQELVFHLQHFEKVGVLANASGRYHLVLALDEIKMVELIEGMARKTYLPKGTASQRIYEKSLGLWKNWNE